MPIDANTLMIAGPTLAAALCAYGWARSNAKLQFVEFEVFLRDGRIRNLQEEITELRMKEARRVEHCRAAAAKGRATQLARAAEKRAKITAEANERSARTFNAMAATSLRPRDEVVADVRAKRAAKHQSAVGVATKTAG